MDKIDTKGRTYVYSYEELLSHIDYQTFSNKILMELSPILFDRKLDWYDLVNFVFNLEEIYNINIYGYYTDELMDMICDLSISLKRCEIINDIIQ